MKTQRYGLSMRLHPFNEMELSSSRLLSSKSLPARTRCFMLGELTTGLKTSYAPVRAKVPFKSCNSG